MKKIIYIVVIFLFFQIINGQTKRDPRVVGLSGAYTTIAEGIAKAHPLRRLGEGKDSASLAKFLITEDSSWVTGQIIAVDGGRSKLS